MFRQQIPQYQEPVFAPWDIEDLRRKKNSTFHLLFAEISSGQKLNILCVCVWWGEGGVCVENIALEQWPCLSTALWGGLQREDPGSLQGLLGVHPTGDRRVTSSPDGAPTGPLPPKPRPQWVEPGSQPCCWLWIL